MKAFTFTTRNVTAGERDEAGEMVLRTLGDVTVTLEGMTRSEVDEWADLTDALNTRGIDEETFRLTVNGWKVTHDGETVGVLFQGAGTRTHVEWYNPTDDDFIYAGQATYTTLGLRHGAAYIVNARQKAGHGLPVDPKPEPVKAPAPTFPVTLRDGTQVTYHGSLTELSGGRYWVMECDADGCYCERYQLMASHPTGGWYPVAVHVGLDSVTAIEGAVNIFDGLAKAA